ncbi:MAG: Gfo/Idh/MocA family protein [Ilumatobacter sp.]|uniref:Gfo/Idh/MocA family protein n=1 Tax=Ilumatobacter sp. TaxID=1967498 RepID=UPI00391C3670
MSQPKLAVVGGRTWGHMHLRALSQFARDGHGELAALVDLDTDILEQRAVEFGMATYSDLEAMLDEVQPDGVTIATPDHLHRDIAVTCLERGIHVLVEKPMDVTVDGCRQMIRSADDNGCLLQVDFMKRKDPYHVDLEQRIRNGQLGDVQYGYSWMEDRIEVPRDWLPAWVSSSDPAWFLGVHVFDLIRWLVRSDVTAVSASASTGKLVSIGIDTYDAVQVKLVFDSGASFAVDVAWHLPDANEAVVNQGVKVVGKEGWMIVDSQDRGARGCLSGPVGAAVGTESRSDGASMFTPNLGLFLQRTDLWNNPVYAGYGIESIQDFAFNVSFLTNGGAIDELGSYPSGRDGLEATKITTAVHDSIEQGGALVHLERD